MNWCRLMVPFPNNGAPCSFGNGFGQVILLVLESARAMSSGGWNSNGTFGDVGGMISVLTSSESWLFFVIRFNDRQVARRGSIASTYADRIATGVNGDIQQLKSLMSTTIYTSCEILHRNRHRLRRRWFLWLRRF